MPVLQFVVFLENCPTIIDECLFYGIMVNVFGWHDKIEIGHFFIVIPLGESYDRVVIFTRVNLQGAKLYGFREELCQFWDVMLPDGVFISVFSFDP
jgi:hypothetical protein